MLLSPPMWRLAGSWGTLDDLASTGRRLLSRFLACQPAHKDPTTASLQPSQVHKPWIAKVKWVVSALITKLENCCRTASKGDKRWTSPENDNLPFLFHNQIMEIGMWFPCPLYWGPLALVILKNSVYAIKLLPEEPAEFSKWNSFITLWAYAHFIYPDLQMFSVEEILKENWHKGLLNFKRPQPPFLQIHFQIIFTNEKPMVLFWKRWGRPTQPTNVVSCYTALFNK